MTTRPDTLNLSLGPQAELHKRHLRQLALALDEPGRRGDGSISSLMILIAEVADGALDELVTGITVARNVANSE